ncbi:hypothetical protein AKG37_15400 [Bacillus australimaris]|uniref:Uncharacterized protein n=1 Tax=Bacillus australimaris TaxID=1326968 RepID=A0ABR5MPI9_9BACI|nr:hypothetical protein AKG37_15400 [Bacillus australimaris]
MKGKTKFLLKFEDFAYHFLKNVTIRAKIAVAFYMSAWIEILKFSSISTTVGVALYMSAWIEIVLLERSES